jgi:hypothetical protein
VSKTRKQEHLRSAISDQRSALTNLHSPSSIRG